MKLPKNVKKVLDGYNRKLKKLTNEIREGKENAPLELIRTMGEQQEEMYDLGYVQYGSKWLEVKKFRGSGEIKKTRTA